MKNAYIVEYLDGSTGIFIGTPEGADTARQNGLRFEVLRPATRDDILAAL